MQYFQYIITILFVDGIYTGSCGCATPTKRLDVDKNLSEIKRTTFKHYPQLEELNVANSGVASIADNAFHDLPRLKQVNISRNFITRLSHEMFVPRNKLRKFDVSSNMLSNLDAFDVSYFPELALLDLSNNQLRFLPENFMRRLESDANLTVITGNNPWDCESENWSNFLDLRGKFCAGLPQAMALRLPQQAGFVTCVFWVFGAFWVGTIVGNVCLIKRIIFPDKPVVKVDQSTNTHHDSVSCIYVHDVIKTECRLKRTETNTELAV